MKTNSISYLACLFLTVTACCSPAGQSRTPPPDQAAVIEETPETMDAHESIDMVDTEKMDTHESIDMVETEEFITPVDEVDSEIGYQAIDVCAELEATLSSDYTCVLRPDFATPSLDGESTTP